MEDQKTAWNEGDTRLATTTSAGSSPSSSLVPCLTLLAHPDSDRVGERIVLPSLALGREVPLSRLQPSFQLPGACAESSGSPLGERFVSRRPIHLRLDEETGELTIDPSDSSTPVEVDDRALTEPRSFSAVEIERGVVLLLGRRIALLLGLASFPRGTDPSRFGLVGESDAVLELRREVERLAPLDVPTLLRGESGTGKELVARALHGGGPRRRGPWVAVNMATLAPSLAAAELFGAVRGAYTGADRDKTGFFQHAEGGTLFLDEIGETPVEVQAMLLRALESHEIVPVGGVEPLPIDVRVIAATDARLERAMAEGSFRAPLYHRLAGYAIQLPSLRARRDDIPRLLGFFLDQERALLDTTPDDRPTWPSARVVASLARHDWPGNVRELRNVARRLTIHPEASLDELLPGREVSAQITAPQAPSEPSAPPLAHPARRVDRPRKRHLRRRPEDVSEDELLVALEEHDHRMRETAEALGLSRVGFYRRLNASPNVRKAADLEAGEIEDALTAADGEIDDAARTLRVSSQGLKRRMTALEIEHH